MECYKPALSNLFSQVFHVIFLVYIVYNTSYILVSIFDYQICQKWRIQEGGLTCL